jgi:FkbM family methyltransferase
MSFVRPAIRSFLEHKGYYFRHRAVLPYGIDYMNDIVRLSALFNHPIRTFIDVGAHIGQTSSEALDAFPEAQVIAFEPEPSCFSELLSRISSPRFHAYNLALDEENRVGMLALNGGTRSSLILTDETASQINVQCRTLDSFCRENSIAQLDVLKIDAEGNEIPILKGSSAMLQSTTFVYCEFFTLTPSPQGTSLIELDGALAEYSFRFITAYTESIDQKPSGLLTVMNALFAKRELFSKNRTREIQFVPSQRTR